LPGDEGLEGKQQLKCNDKGEGDDQGSDKAEDGERERGRRPRMEDGEQGAGGPEGGSPARRSL